MTTTNVNMSFRCFVTAFLLQYACPEPVILANEECWHACGKKLRKEQERIERAVSVFRFRVCVFSSSAINAHRAARCPWIQTIQTYRAGRAGGRPHRAPADKKQKRNAASTSTTSPMCVCVCVSRAAYLGRRSSFLAAGNSIASQSNKKRAGALRPYPLSY
jgi:hypothetical protein